MSKSLKKKKYNARFPPARIKKIMQTDEDVGKVAAAVPVIISRALELFIESLVTETSKLTIAKKAKTMSTSHIKQTIKNTKQFDFLNDVVKNVPDHCAEDGNGNDDVRVEGEPSMSKKKGRPRKSDSIDGRKKSSNSKKAASSDEDEEDEDDDDDDDEATESEDESASRTSVDNNINRGHPGLHGAQATSSYHPPHHPYHPSFYNIQSSHNNNNNSFLPSAGSTSQGTHHVRDSLISGQDAVQSPALNYPVFGPITFPRYPVPPSFYQIPSNSGIPMNYSPFVPSSKLPTLPSPSFIQGQMSQALNQHQPIDLTHSSKKDLVNEDDDYDT